MLIASLKDSLDFKDFVVSGRLFHLAVMTEKKELADISDRDSGSNRLFGNLLLLSSLDFGGRWVWRASGAL